MMKKKVKKIPKYKNGTPTVKPYVDDFSFSNSIGEHWQNMSGNAKANAVAGGIGAVGTMVSNATRGQKVTAGGVISGMGSGAAAGAAIGGPWGAFAGGILGGVTSAMGRTNGVNYDSVSTNINDIKEEGSGILKFFGMSDEEMNIKANLVQNNNIAKIQTEQQRAKYAMNPNVQTQPVLVAEGGIMRKPVDALVSPGEIAINPYTLEYRQFGSDNEEPNSKDNIRTVLLTYDNVKSHAKHMIMPNGKTPADNSKMVLDSNMPEETKRKMIKKIDNWESAHRTKPQEYAKFDGGGIAGINKYGYNKNMSDFAYWDKDKNEYKKEYLDWVNNLTEQDVRDIEAGKYGDMTEYFSKNKGKKLDVATAQKLMTDKKYGNWHKIGQAVVDNKIKTKGPALDAVPHMAKQINIFPGMKERVVHHVAGDGDNKAELTHLYTQGLEIPKLKKLPNPSEADGVIAARKYLSKQNTPNWLDEMSNLLPVIGGLFDKYDWHTEQSQITPPRFVPVNADPRPLLRAADESLTMARYNQANISPNTGAGMAYGLQAASNRAKIYADAYKWQQETNNKLIAQNAGIYNDWRKQRDAYATQAIADTRANEGAAQQMKDQARKDRLEFYYGKRNDDMLTAMMEPMFEYGTPDEAYRPVYRRRIV